MREKSLSVVIILLPLIFLMLGIQEGFCQFSNEDCMMCHSDNTMLKELPDGTTKSLFVDQNIIGKSMHKGVSCVDCHSGIEDLPHSEKLKKPDCSFCHADEGSILSKGLHYKIEGACWQCHGKHDILSSKDPKAPTNKRNAQKLCLVCHKDRTDKTFSQYAHSQVIFPGGARGRVACGQCHNPHLPTLPDPAIACNGCHPQVLIDLKKDIHSDLSCHVCHTEHTPSPPKEDKMAFLMMEISQCRSCHPKDVDEYFSGVHGKEFEKKNVDTPTCISCHEAHKILSSKNPNSPVFHTNIVALCVKCHEDEKITAKYKELPKPLILKAYENSVHGQAVQERGLLAAPSCIDCHGYHELRPADDPKSPVNKVNIAFTCARCHPEVEKVYKESIHGQDLAQGILDSPTCTDCHGEHDIVAVADTASRVSPKHIAMTCSYCHAEEALASKYDLPSSVFQTYRSSFHGIANKYGELVVAECASCHGYHNILPSSDPKSSINPNNIVETCGRCHKGVSENFAKGNIHIQATKESSPGVFMVRRFYTWFIGILVFLFVAYILLEVVGRSKRRKREA